MADSYNSEHLSLLGVQSILMLLLIHRSYVTAARVAMYQYQPLLQLIAQQHLLCHNIIKGLGTKWSNPRKGRSYIVVVHAEHEKRLTYTKYMYIYNRRLGTRVVYS